MNKSRKFAMKPAVPAHRISVAMATFNGEKYIDEQLASIARQELLPFELVVTDDGSTDRTLQIVDEFAQSVPFPVRVFRNESQLGYAENFLKAASLCEGELIAFCDQDDIWLEQKLKLCSQYFEDAEIVLTIHSSQKFGTSGGAERYPHLKTQVLEPNAIDPYRTLPGFAMVMRRELLSLVDSRLRPSRLHGHDHWLWFLAVCSGKVATIDEPLTMYRQHGGNVFGAPKRRSFVARVASVATTLGYEEFADSEILASNLLLKAAKEWPLRSEQLQQAARLLAFRSKLHRLRTEVYKRESNLAHRAAIYGRILFAGGYLRDRTGTRLGAQAAWKDLLFGVPGIYRLLLRMSERS
jgi:rhamnosyltransferase